MYLSINRMLGGIKGFCVLPAHCALSVHNVCCGLMVQWYDAAFARRRFGVRIPVSPLIIYSFASTCAYIKRKRDPSLPARTNELNEFTWLHLPAHISKEREGTSLPARTNEFTCLHLLCWHFKKILIYSFASILPPHL